MISFPGRFEIFLRIGKLEITGSPIHTRMKWGIEQGHVHNPIRGDEERLDK
jgi:hypothetical protein